MTKLWYCVGNIWGKSHCDNFKTRKKIGAMGQLFCTRLVTSNERKSDDCEWQRDENGCHWNKINPKKHVCLHMQTSTTLMAYLLSNVNNNKGCYVSTGTNRSEVKMMLYKTKMVNILQTQLSGKINKLTVRLLLQFKNQRITVQLLNFLGQGPPHLLIQELLRFEWN